ncbi:MAG: CHASE domain-containing protein [Rubripirellula sp.]
MFGRTLDASQQPTAVKRLAMILVVGFGYFVAGRLGQMLAVPPSYATAVWPASAIAFVACLLLGNRVWPGVLLGAWFVNAWTPLLQANDMMAAMQSLLPPLSISVGASLQAVLGATLVRRRIGFPNSLIQDRQILIFLLLGGPVACLLGATWGVTTLAIFGVVSGVGIAINWWTWWVGDVLGVIIFAPLLMIAFAQPRTVWRPRLLSVALPLTAAFVFAVLGFLTLQTLAQERQKEQFDGFASIATQFFEEQLDSHVGVMDSLERFCTSSDHVRRTEFESFNRRALERHRGVHAIAWLPRVTEDQLEEFVTQSKLDSFSIATDDTDDSGLSKPTASEHFPIQFIEPIDKRLISRGTNVASDPDWLATMRACRDKGQRMAAIPRATDHGGYELYVFAPIYARDKTPETIEARRKELRGYVLGIFHVADIASVSLPGQYAKAFNIEVTDVSTSPRMTIYRRNEQPSPYKVSEVAPIIRRPLRFAKTLGFVDHQWVCELTPTQSFYAAGAGRRTWLMLASGLALTALFGTFLMILSARTARIQASEGRYLDLYEHAPDMFISVDVGSQRVIECNRTFLEATGFRKTEIIDRHLYDLFDLESRTDARRAFRQFLVNGQAKDIELRLRCANQQFLETSMNVSAVRYEEGAATDCRAVLRDITEKKIVETRIKNQEMELAHVARLTMMGEMATGLAHEINQPLAAIAAYAEGAAIRIRDGKSDSEGMLHVVDRISADAHRAGEVIRRLRQFVRKREPDRCKLDLNPLVREVAHFVASDLRRRDVTLGLDLQDRLPDAMGDPIQIQQVLLNLVRNGVDSMHDVDPTLRRMMIRTRSGEHGDLLVEIEDNGHGLKDGATDQLFEAFFSTKQDGLGMGLAISRSIIETHQGQIWATANVEGGTTFHFSLPAIQQGVGV